MAKNEPKGIQSSSSSSIGLEVIRVLVSHGGKDLLGIRQLGRLSMVSKSAAAILDDALVWRTLFEEATHASRKYLQHYSFGHFLQAGHASICWKHRSEGLFACFSDPTEAVLDRVGGYKRAAGC